MTNFEKIKEQVSAMSIDELIPLLKKVTPCCGNFDFCLKNKGICNDCFKEWLESEVEE